MPRESLSGLLLDGRLDAVLSAHPPGCFADRPQEVVRLVADHAEVERNYWETSGVFPIMHTVAIRRDIVEANPWVPVALFKGFERAKRRSVARLRDMTVSRYPVPWLQEYVDSVWSGFAPGDPWPYGAEANRVTLETFIGWAREQGVVRGPLPLERLFHRGTADPFRI